MRSIPAILKSIANDNPHRYKGLRYPDKKGRDIIELARKHFLAMDELSLTFAPQQGYWDKKVAIMKDDILKLRNVSDAIAYAQSKTGFDHRQIVKKWHKYLSLYDDRLKCEFPQCGNLINQLGDSNYSKPDMLLKYHGRLVSNIYYFHMRELLQCATHIKQPNIVCEIGGGYSI